MTILFLILHLFAELHCSSQDFGHFGVFCPTSDAEEDVFERTIPSHRTQLSERACGNDLTFVNDHYAVAHSLGYFQNMRREKYRRTAVA